MDQVLGLSMIPAILNNDQGGFHYTVCASTLSYCERPDVEDHSAAFENTGLRMSPLHVLRRSPLRLLRNCLQAVSDLCHSSWNLMVGLNPLWVYKQHGHSILTMLRVYAAWVEGQTA